MEQKTYNKATVGISILALALPVGFPFLKSNIIDKPKIYNSSGKYIELSHYFGNSTFGLDVNLVNTGEKASVITKIEGELFNGDNELIIDRKEVEIFYGEEPRPQNVIALNSKAEGKFQLRFEINSTENEEDNLAINRLNAASIEYLNKQGFAFNNYLDTKSEIQLSDSIFNKIEEICMRNFQSLKLGTYKIVYHIFQDSNKRPSISFGKSFKITHENKLEIIQSILNYKWGSHLCCPSKLLYSHGSQIRVYDLSIEEIKQLGYK